MKDKVDEYNYSVSSSHQQTPEEERKGKPQRCGLVPNVSKELPQINEKR